MLRKAAFACLLAAPLLVTGCIGVGSSRSYNQPPTVGQQLTDLKIAYDQGAVTDAEYDRLKADIMNESHRKHRH